MKSDHLSFDNLNEYLTFQGAIIRNFLPSVKLSIKELYCVLLLHESPLNLFIFTNKGYYSDKSNTYRVLVYLCSRGYVVKIGEVYHNTGKGEAVCLQFLDFCRAHGVAGE